MVAAACDRKCPENVPYRAMKIDLLGVYGDRHSENLTDRFQRRPQEQISNISNSGTSEALALDMRV